LTTPSPHAPGRVVLVVVVLVPPSEAFEQSGIAAADASWATKAPS